MLLGLFAQIPVAAGASAQGAVAGGVPWANMFLNVLALTLGGVAGGGVAFFIRKLILRAKFKGFPHQLATLDAITFVMVTAVAGLFELWKPSTFTSLNPYSLGGYTLGGLLIGLGCTLKWLLSVAKETTRATVENLRARLESAEKECVRRATLESLVGEAMNEKLTRFSKSYREEGGLISALEPEKQIRLLISILHRQVQKHLKAGNSLRIGIYLLSEDEKVLEPAHSWDGQNTKVFSGRHGDFMRLSAPGGARSAVVEAWNQPGPEPFIFIPDTEIAEREKKFRFFEEAHRKKICSMVAYRHNMTGVSPNDAFVVTLDSNQVGLFASDVEAECRLYLPAFSRRIELELLASYLTPNTLAPPIPK